MIPEPRESDALALNIDLAPTILDIAGITVPEDMDMDGESLRQILEGNATSVRDSFVVEQQLNDTRRQYGIRTEDHLYAVYENGEVELYDLDPDSPSYDEFQLTNRAYDTAQITTRCGLANALEDLLPDGVGPPLRDSDCDLQANDHEVECGSLPGDPTNFSADSEPDGTPDCVDIDDDNDGQGDELEAACGSDPTDAESRSPDHDGTFPRTASTRMTTTTAGRMRVTTASLRPTPARRIPTATHGVTPAITATTDPTLGRPTATAMAGAMPATPTPITTAS